METDFAKQAEEVGRMAPYYAELIAAFFYLTDESSRMHATDAHVKDLLQTLSDSKHHNDLLYQYFINKLRTDDSLVSPADILQEIDELKNEATFGTEPYQLIDYFAKAIKIHKTSKVESAIAVKLKLKLGQIEAKISKLNRQNMAKQAQLSLIEAELLKLKSELRTNKERTSSQATILVGQIRELKDTIEQLKRDLDQTTADTTKLKEERNSIQKLLSSSLEKNHFYDTLIRNAIDKLDRILADYSGKGTGSSGGAGGAGDSGGAFETPPKLGQPQPQPVSPPVGKIERRDQGQDGRQLYPASLPLKW